MYSQIGPCSAIIREASSCSKQMGTNRDPHLDSMQRVRELGIFSPKWVNSINSLPPAPRTLEIVQKKRHKELKSQRG